VLLLVGGTAGHPTRGEDREPEEPTVFPDGKHRDDVFYYCTPCHGSALIRAQGHSRPRWAEVLQIMVERHGMPPLEGDDLEQTLDYLAAAFPPRGRSAQPSPFLNRRAP
jgi:hypothetical protein